MYTQSLKLTGDDELRFCGQDWGLDMIGLARYSLGMLLLTTAPQVLAHVGGLNAEGCHSNRKTGDYHCHRGGSTPPRASPQPQRFSASPTGAFRNCAEARAAGAAPVRRGDPGYGPHLDRDGDGVGCEPYRR